MSLYNEPQLKPLGNGAMLCSMAHSSLNISTIGFLVGCRNDPCWYCGLFHDVEHNMCRGAKEIPGRHIKRVTSRQVDRMMRRHLGGSNGPGMNVYTLHDRTSYGHLDLLYLKYLKYVFGTNAGMIRDGMYDLRRFKPHPDNIIDADVHQLEKAAVGAETGENDDVLDLAVYKMALKLLYTTNPARFFGDSDPVQLEQVKLGRKKQFAAGWYVPRKLRIIILGPTQKQAMRMVKEAELDQIPDWEPAVWSYDHSDDIPVLSGIREEIVERANIVMTHQCLMWPTETSQTPDRYALEVLVGVLKDRLEYELREKNRVHRGGVYHPLVDWDHTTSNGYLSLHFATRGEWLHAQDLLARALKVVEQLKTDQSVALDEDVRDSRENLADDFLEDFHFGTHLADRILAAMAKGDDNLEDFKQYRQRILHVTAKQVRAVAAKYLTTDKFVKAVIRPAL